MQSPVILDLEIYKDWFLAAFREVATGKVALFEMYDGHPLDVDKVARALKKHTIVTFNGNGFDLPLLELALEGATCKQIKARCDAIIKNNKRMRHGLDIDHIDLMEVAPGQVSLKTYGGRLHARTLQDLPIEPDASIGPAEREALKTYCQNDLVLTQTLLEKLTPQIELRERMSQEYGIDLRSKSDAQIAEAVIAHGLRQHKLEVTRPEIEGGTVYYYKAPRFISFKSDTLRTLLDDILAAQFVVADTGKVMMPQALEDRDIVIGASTYRMGIGGLHSTESNVAHLADADHVLIDRDVASYYPAIILNTGLTPTHMGKAFTKVYRGIVERRLEAKRNKDTVTADSLKITINGSFGKFGSKWSILFSPDLLIQTTITGQLSLLMLIEAIEAAGIPVVSANTDGVVIKCPTSRLNQLETLIFWWEQVTGFDTEETQYKALYSESVNSYIAIKTDGKVKIKGPMAPAGLNKNPVNEIVTEAVVKYLRDGKPIEETVRECQDICKFITLRNVKGGALDQQGNYLGKVVRWYYSLYRTGAFTYKVNGHAVPRSDCASPLMTLPDVCPKGIDYYWYIQEARGILSKIGAGQ